MLNQATAFEVVNSSVRNAFGDEPTSGGQSLADLGCANDAELESLVTHIVKHVDGLEQKIDRDMLSGSLQSSLTVTQVAHHVMRLSAGKLCSNPNNPHDQLCCPYPARCPQCGWPV